MNTSRITLGELDPRRPIREQLNELNNKPRVRIPAVTKVLPNGERVPRNVYSKDKRTWDELEPKEQGNIWVSSTANERQVIMTRVQGNDKRLLKLTRGMFLCQVADNAALEDELYDVRERVIPALQEDSIKWRSISLSMKEQCDKQVDTMRIVQDEANLKCVQVGSLAKEIVDKIEKERDDYKAKYEALQDKIDHLMSGKSEAKPEPTHVPTSLAAANAPQFQPVYTNSRDLDIDAMFDAQNVYKDIFEFSRVVTQQMAPDILTEEVMDHFEGMPIEDMATLPEHIDVEPPEPVLSKEEKELADKKRMRMLYLRSQLKGKVNKKLAKAVEKLKKTEKACGDIIDEDATSFMRLEKDSKASNHDALIKRMRKAIETKMVRKALTKEGFK